MDLGKKEKQLSTKGHSRYEIHIFVCFIICYFIIIIILFDFVGHLCMCLIDAPLRSLLVWNFKYGVFPTEYLSIRITDAHTLHPRSLLVWNFTYLFLK